MFLGVDPGIRKLGFAITDNNRQIYELGAIVNELEGGRIDNARRLFEISEFFDEILVNYKIKSVCIEKNFFTKYNQSNAEFVFGVRGILLSKFYQHNINILELSPSQIKKYITGNGAASKETMQKTIQKLYYLEEIPKPHDAADALGMAYIANLLLK